MKSETEQPHGNYLVTQLVLALSMLIVTTISGLIPLVIMRYLKSTNRGWMSYLSCFSGGVFMATCFLDILPHIGRTWISIQRTHDLEVHFPLPQAVICCGFFLVYLIEHFTTWIFTVDPAVLTKKPRKCPDNINMEVEENSSWDVESESGILKATTFAVAISFHSLLEGFALGVQDSTVAIYALFFSLLIHKAVEAFSVGIQISKENEESKIKLVVITIVVYALMTPVGSILGTFLLNSGGRTLFNDILMLLLECCAGGTFIYVTFIEILAHEKNSRFNKLKQLLSIISGFVLICGLQIIFESL